MKKSYLFLLFFLSLNTVISAQDNFYFKVGLNKLLSKQFFIATEFKPLKSFSFNMEFGVLKKAFYLETVDFQRAIGEIRTNKTSNSESFRFRTNAKIGYQLNLEGRYRPGKELTEGMYLGVKTGFQYVDFGLLEVGFYKDDIFDSPAYSKEILARQRTWLMGGTLGFNFKIKKSLLLDLNIFSGYVYSELRDPGKPEFIPYTDPEHNQFRNNHRNSIDQFRVDLNVFIGF